MSRNLVIRLAISLIFISFVYILFWFFKVGQLEKRVARFVNDNSAYISVGKIESSGFPLAQNITVTNVNFSIPNPIFSKRQISISELHATSGIFADNFILTFPQGVSTQNDKGEIARVKFNSDPNVNVKLGESNNIEFNYEDSGYALNDPQERLVLAAKSSKIKILVNSSDQNNIRVNIDSDIQEIEGFDIVDIYNNVLKEAIQKDIQTGNIKFGSTKIVEEPKVEANNNEENNNDELAKENPVEETVETAVQESQPAIPPQETLESTDAAQKIAAPEVTNENLNAEITSDEKLVVSNENTAPDQESEKIEVEQLAQNTDNKAEQIEVEQLANDIKGSEEEVIEINQLAQENAQENPEPNNEEIQVIVEEEINPVEDSLEDNSVEASEVVESEENSEASEIITQQEVQEQQTEVAPSVQNEKVAESSVVDPSKEKEENVVNSEVKEEDLDIKNRYTQGVKSNLKFSLVYTLSPNNSSEKLDLPFDPTKIQELPTQYNKEIKINNLEFSNSNYQILSNGTLNMVADDTMPFGTLSIIIQNHNSFIGYLKDYIKVYLGSKGYDIDPVKEPATEVVAKEIAQEVEVDQQETKEVVNDEKVKPVENAAAKADNVEVLASEVVTEEQKVEVVTKEIVIKDGYDNFLKKIYDNLSLVSEEISGQNPASTNEESRYEVKREKNLEFRINSTPIREILGKF